MTTAVVVGHGRSAEGKAWGSLIDGADYVVRLWNCEWQDEADYGRRYDYGMFEISPALYPAFKVPYDAGDIPKPSQGWIGLYLKGTVPEVLPPETQVLKQNAWADVGKSLGGMGATGRLRLTRGVICACWAMTHKGCDRLVLVGFDNVYIGSALPIEEGFSEAYRRSPGIFGFGSYIPGGVKMGNHDLAIERKLLEVLAAKHSVDLKFSQDVWK